MNITKYFNSWTNFNLLVHPRKMWKSSEPPPLPLTHPPPFGSGAPRGSPMKFTTFHQHHQLVAHPQHTPTNGNYNNGNNFPTQTIHVTNQQHYVMPQQTHHHHQQQFFDNNPGSNYVTNSNYSKMSAPLAPAHHQQQRSSAIWHQQYTSSTSPMKNDFNGNSNNESG